MFRSMALRIGFGSTILWRRDFTKIHVIIYDLVATMLVFSILISSTDWSLFLLSLVALNADEVFVISCETVCLSGWWVGQSHNASLSLKCSETSGAHFFMSSFMYWDKLCLWIIQMIWLFRIKKPCFPSS